VLFTETAGNYTYIQLKQEEKELWLASAPFEVAVGDQIEYAGGVPMRDFHVKTLDRTFDEILFLSNIRKVVDEPEGGAGAAVMPADDLHRNLATQSPAALVPNTGEVIRAEGDLSIADLFAKRAELTGQTVSLRAKVIKVSNNIQGKTWLTMADGTGAAPDDLLRVVTDGNAEIGQVLSVRGVVRTDVDLGAGYKYKLLVDEAELSN